MNKQTQFAWEFRIRCFSKATSFTGFSMAYDFCRGFMFALLSADVISEAEFDAMGAQLTSAISESFRWLPQVDKSDVFALQDEAKDEECEQVSVSAASAGLRVFCLLCGEGRTKAYPVSRFAWPRLPFFWAPLPGKRSLVGRESQMCLPSFKQPPP